MSTFLGRDGKPLSRGIRGRPKHSPKSGVQVPIIDLFPSLLKTSQNWSSAQTSNSAARTPLVEDFSDSDDCLITRALNIGNPIQNWPAASTPKITENWSATSNLSAALIDKTTNNWTTVHTPKTVDSCPTAAASKKIEHSLLASKTTDNWSSASTPKVIDNLSTTPKTSDNWSAGQTSKATDNLSVTSKTTDNSKTVHTPLTVDSCPPTATLKKIENSLLVLKTSDNWSLASIPKVTDNLSTTPKTLDNWSAGQTLKATDNWSTLQAPKIDSGSSVLTKNWTEPSSTPQKNLVVKDSNNLAASQTAKTASNWRSSTKDFEIPASTWRSNNNTIEVTIKVPPASSSHGSISSRFNKPAAESNASWGNKALNDEKEIKSDFNNNSNLHNTSKSGWGNNKASQFDYKKESSSFLPNKGFSKNTSGWGNQNRNDKQHFEKDSKNKDNWNNTEGEEKRRDKSRHFGLDNSGNKKESVLKPYSAYVPENRLTDVLFEEDALNAEVYLSVADGDEEITITGQTVGDLVKIDSWSEAKLEQAVLNNIEKCKYVRPRKIQAQCIPLILEGRDILALGETGSGKTAAFMIPLINMIIKDKDFGAPYLQLGRPSPFAIIIEPTRELCVQVAEQGRKFASGTNLKVAKAYGQYSRTANRREIMMGCDILCATPGRLFEILEDFRTQWILLDKLKFLVLDEMDRLLEDNFIDTVRQIVETKNFPAKEKRQNLLFSATFPEVIQKLAQDVMKNEESATVRKQNFVSTNNKIIQRFLSVTSETKKKALLELLTVGFVGEEKKSTKTLVFVKTKRDASVLSLWLNAEGIKSTDINGDRTQSQRERALYDFCYNDKEVLVSTDVCARGIDIKDLNHVVNYDMPDDSVTYVHRIGRTGRIRGGFATSLFDEYSENDRSLAKDLLKFVQESKQEAPEFLKKCAENPNLPTSSFADLASVWETPEPAVLAPTISVAVENTDWD